MILASPGGAASSHTALAFVRSAIRQGYRIQCLFFYHEAAQLGSSLTVSNQDEINLPACWQALIAEHRLEAVVCIASALKRGIIDDDEARRYQKTAASLDSRMTLAGLGQWIEAVRLADRHIVFPC